MFPQKWISIKLILLVVGISNAAGQDNHDSPISGKPRFIIEQCFGATLENGIYIKTDKDRQISWMSDNKMEFDRKGNLIKRSYFADDNSFLHAEEFEYNTNLLCKKKNQAFVYTYKYDSRGNTIEELVAPINDSTDKKTKHRFAYNGNNLLTDVWEFDFGGVQIFHQSNSYSSDGKLMKENYDYSDGREFKNYSYDLDNRLIKIEWFDAHTGLMERTTFSYNENGLATELWEGIEKNKVESTTRYEFDTKRNLISIADVNPKRQINDREIIKYIFDPYGNWIKKMTSINDSRYYIIERFIAYY